MIAEPAMAEHTPTRRARLVCINALGIWSAMREVRADHGPELGIRDRSL